VTGQHFPENGNEPVLHKTCGKKSAGEMQEREVVR
jgi:hypothetical protein